MPLRVVILHNSEIAVCRPIKPAVKNGIHGYLVE
jgi:hypothetical protein